MTEPELDERAEVMASMFGGWVDNVLSRLTELFQVLPGLLFAMVLLTLAMTYIYPAMVTYLPDQFFNQAEEIPVDPNDESVVNPDVFKK